MIPARVIIAYFSPTGGTKKVALALKDGCSATLVHQVKTPSFTIKLPTTEVPVTTFNCLTAKSRHKDLQLTANDLFILAYPVYFGRMP